MPIFDRVDLACPDIDPTRWPKLSCGAASQLALHDSSLRLEGDRELLFQDGGQIRSFDDTHKLVFNRPSNLLELHERGSIRFLTGEPTPSEKVRIGADGRVGIGTETPEAMLHIAGDLRIDNSVGVTGAAHVSGNLQVEGNVGIGTTSSVEPLEVNGRIKSGALTIGPWPANPNRYMFFGTNALNQADAGNYALLQAAADVDQGVTYLNSPVSIHFRIRNGDQMVLANNGHVGIGTSNPSSRLEIAAQDGLAITGFQPFITLRDANGGNARSVIQGVNGDIVLIPNSFIGGGAALVAKTTSGNVGIGTAQPRFTLEVSGSAGKPGGGMWTNSSDQRLKRNVKTLQGALKKLLKLRGVSYLWKEPEKHGNLAGEQMGLVAQEAEEVFPEWVSTNTDGFKDLTIRGLEALVVEAFRELNNRIEVLELKGEA